MTKPKISWPQTPADVRRLLASNCECIILGDENGDPNENDKYRLSAHDLLSAFSEWVDFGREPEPEPQQEQQPVDVGSLEYNGNSVSFLYQKMKAYQKGVDDAWRSLKAKGLHPDGKTSLADMITRHTAPQPQPQQEPVAWYDGKKFYGSQAAASMDMANMAVLAPLYTHQPQRHPLTNGEILAVLDATDIPDLPFDFRDVDIDISQAIEAAHGIK